MPRLGYIPAPAFFITPILSTNGRLEDWQTVFKRLLEIDLAVRLVLGLHQSMLEETVAAVGADNY